MHNKTIFVIASVLAFQALDVYSMEKQNDQKELPKSKPIQQPLTPEMHENRPSAARTEEQRKNELKLLENALKNYFKQRELGVEHFLQVYHD